MTARLICLVATIGLTLCGCATRLSGPPPRARAAGAAPAVAQTPMPSAVIDARTGGLGGTVPTSIIRGAQPYPIRSVVDGGLRPGDVSLNFPSADVHDVARTILNDMLHLPYSIDSRVMGNVTLVTARPIARVDVLRAFEDALRVANMAVLRRGGAYVIAPLAEARSQAPLLSRSEAGFGVETIELHFINAAALKKLLDPVVPDTLSVADPSHNVITVTGTTGQRRSIHDLVAQFDVDWLKGMSFALYVPQHTDSRIIVPEIEKLLNGEGAPSAGLVRLIAMERINGVLAISAQPQYLDDVKRWIEVLDHEGQSSERRLYVYRVQNGRSSDLAKVLNTAFGATTASGSTTATSTGVSPASRFGGLDPEPTRTPPPIPVAVGTGGAAPPVAGSSAGGLGGAVISSDDANNAVLVYGTPREYAVVEDALRKLDIAPLQVLIEAAITEVELTHDLRYGVQWNFATKNGGTFNLTDGKTAAAQPFYPGFSYLYANGGSITATLNALSALTTVNVLSAPKLLVLNNQTASLQVGDEVPIVSASSQSTIGNNSPIVNSVEYRDTGVILKVTPRVNSGGLVLLDIAQEVSDVAPTTSSSINSPTIQERRFSSSIAVQDGQTIALGGLIRDNHTKGRSGIPILSGIPGLGALVGQHTTADTRTELLILLTPRVIRTPVDAEAVTEELRHKIEAIEPLKPIKSFRP